MKSMTQFNCDAQGVDNYTNTKPLIVVADDNPIHLKLLVSVVKNFNSLTISGLQKYQYLFRLGIRETKGLKNINFFEKSIFKSKGEKDEGKEQS